MGLSCQCNRPAHLAFFDVKSWYQGDLLDFKDLSNEILNQLPK